MTHEVTMDRYRQRPFISAGSPVSLTANLGLILTCDANSLVLTFRPNHDKLLY